MNPTEQHALATFVAEEILEATPHRELVQPEDDGMYLDGWKLQDGRFVTSHDLLAGATLALTDVVPRVLARLGPDSSFVLELTKRGQGLADPYARFFDPMRRGRRNWSAQHPSAVIAVYRAARRAWEATCSS